MDSTQSQKGYAAARLAIVIVAYDSNDEMRECFSSLDRHNPIGDALEVVVVDNKPVTGLRGVLDAEPHTFTYRYVENPANTGFGAGNNLGVSHTTAPVLLFLNPDTVMVADIVTPALEAINADPECVVGFRLTDRAGRPNYSYSYFPEYVWLFPLLHLLEKISFNWFANHCRPVNRLIWPWGAAFALRRDRFLAAGAFDERIFLCSEEPDLMKRLPRRRVRILSVPLVHLEGHGRVVSEARHAAYIDSCDYYLRKHRIRSRRLFWKWTAAKLRLRRVLRLPFEANLWAAFSKADTGGRLTGRGGKAAARGQNAN